MLQVLFMTCLGIHCLLDRSHGPCVVEIVHESPGRVAFLKQVWLMLAANHQPYNLGKK